MRGEGRGNIQRGQSSRGGEARRGNDSSNRSERPSGSTIERRGERPDATTVTPRSTGRSDRTDRTYDRSDRTDRSNAGETRTYDRTDRSTRGETRTYDRNRTDANRSDSRTYDRSNGGNRNNGGSRNNGGTYDRNRGDNNRGDNNRGNNDRGRDSNWRGGSSRGDSRSYGRSDRGRSSNHQPYYGSGRVSRVHPYNGGYRVYIVGSPYPFFIPSAYWRYDRFRVGLSIRLGGYYNPLGYYDYYDGYADNREYSEGSLRGVVESVDYRRDTFVVRNDATGSFVTVVMRDRRDDNVRAGDYVELYGDWSRSGVFEAVDVDLLDDARR
jgi:hypothetical protein